MRYSNTEQPRGQAWKALGEFSLKLTFTAFALDTQEWQRRVDFSIRAETGATATVTVRP